jgi:ABC-type antimicrobial peptide transport system permease subunit
VLYQVRPSDPGTALLASLVLLAAATVACLPAALRATRVNPVEGLRVD